LREPLLRWGRVDRCLGGKKTSSYLFLKKSALFRGEGIGLGDKRDEIDFVVESLHELDIEVFQAVAGRGDHVQAAVHSAVGNRYPVHPRLCIQELFISILNVFYYRLPTRITKKKILCVTINAN